MQSEVLGFEECAKMMMMVQSEAFNVGVGSMQRGGGGRSQKS